jgi:hypothetical protein
MFLPKTRLGKALRLYHDIPESFTAFAIFLLFIEMFPSLRNYVTIDKVLEKLYLLIEKTSHPALPKPDQNNIRGV